MPELVALALPAGDRFVDAVLRTWDAGDAVLPLDVRAPDSHVGQILRSLAPGAVIEDDGERRHLSGGVPVEPGDAVVVATSATTGDAKGVVHTHDSIAAAARITAPPPRGGGDVPWWLACLPLSHVGGLSVITRALLNDARLEVHDRADAGRIDAAARRGATHVSLVPTLVRRIDASLWDLILLGGSAVPPDRPANSVATYGMTETFGGVVYDGRPLPEVEVRITSADADGVGIVELRSPSLLRAYRHGADGSAAPDGSNPRVADGWYRTDDLGSTDRSGLLSVSGRADDLIVTGGVKVWPTPVERVIRTDPDVADVAVVGCPDPEWGRRVVAVVVPTDPSRPPSLDALRARVRAQLPVAAAPKELRIADVLPRTALGKLVRHRLASDTPSDGSTVRDPTTGSGEAGSDAP